MPATLLDVYTVPFQESIYLSNDLTTADEEMEFVNDGYTLLYVINGDEEDTTTVSVDGVPNAAGRDKTLEVDLEPETSALFGPFRPIWWNQAGTIRVSFESDDEDGDLSNVSVKVIRVQV